ncbi:DNA-binding transcriptional MerR regulator [Arthrobacter woluwensis]|uniref:MerR family transcriptional regulator n=1 Tax=Arthrobacter woluwensis TaxID=156980 RepID=UPI0027855454|nr:MerR family transcriptional regulator [Arthrobacter woluwensis]MDQ0708721.1 DNA-binding transcriptional MerR regulator [Arthrobacter woluwensis]
MKISELARRTGLAPSAIRFYEDRDMFSPGQVNRLANGYRDYTPQAQRRVELILAGRAAGFSLTQMRDRMTHWETMSDGERAALLEEQLAVIDGRLRELTSARATVREALETLRGRGAAQ